MMEKLKKAKAEKEAYDKVYQEVWDQEITDFDELRYMKFFKAGIEYARTPEKEVCPELQKQIDMRNGIIQDLREYANDLPVEVIDNFHCDIDNLYQLQLGTGEKPDSTKELFDEAVDELTYARTILMGWDSSFINDMNQMNISRDTQDAVKTIDGLLTRIKEKS